MREILFRGKQIHNGEWIEGNLVHSIYKMNDTCIGKFGCSLGFFSVDPETVGQYTGFRDVDKVRIFEGDIVKDIESGYHYIVKWFDEYGCYGLANKAGHMEIDVSELEIYIDYLVVVGNVHDNGNLLTR